jgi:endonuclease YncB( thermonuclease family)
MYLFRGPWQLAVLGGILILGFHIFSKPTISLTDPTPSQGSQGRSVNWMQVSVDLVSVLDGDTVIVRRGPEFGEEHVRLLNVDAPEIPHPGRRLYSGGPTGWEAKRALKDLVANRPLRLVLQGKKDVYGRTLAHLFYRTSPGGWANVSVVLAQKNLLAVHGELPTDLPQQG